MKSLRLTDNERLELGDLQFGFDTSVFDAAGKGGSSVSGQSGVILSGFSMSNPSGKQLRVLRDTTGRAILSYREAGTVKRGALIGEGTPAEQTFDLSAYTTGTYNIYLRAERAPSDNGNRIFWNAPSTTERVGSTATRIEERWSVRVDLSSPGQEWTLIGEVVVGVSSLTITDKRPFAFEGLPSETYNPFYEWGAGANDRNADRATYGVKDVRTAIRALQRQVQCILDGDENMKWWDAPEANEGLLQKLGIFGGVGVGAYEFSGPVTVNNLWNFNEVAVSDVLNFSYLGSRATPYTLTTAKDVPFHLRNTSNATGVGAAHSTMLMSTGFTTPSGYAIDIYNRALGAPVFNLAVWSPGAPAINGLKALSIDFLNQTAEWSVDLIPSALGLGYQRLGAPATPWADMFGKNIDANRSIGRGLLQPLNQEDLLVRNGLNSVIAALHGPSTGTALGARWNVNAVRSWVVGTPGTYVYTFTQAIPDDCIIQATPRWTSSLNASAVPVIRTQIGSSGTQLTVTTGTIASGTTFTQNNVEHDILIVGSPRTAQPTW